MVFCNETGEVYELLSCILFSLTAPVVNISEVYTFYRYLFFSTFSTSFDLFFFTLKKMSMEGVDEKCTSHFCIKTEKNSHAFIIMHEDYESGGSHCQ